MKKLYSLILILSLLFTNLSFVKANSSEYTYFVVTAYYSPLPDQSVFYRWNFALETRLNWRWIAWASWREVFPWMIAAPSNYAFWTKIELDWIWVWSVEDRWWAIVAHNAPNSRWYSYDRIDIWMWHWEEWLRRALAWWKRTVRWRIVSRDTPTSIDINNFNMANQITLSNREVVRFNDSHTSIVKEEDLVDSYQKDISQDSMMEIFNRNIWPESDSDSIKKLQELFWDMWYYYWELSWNYDDIKDILIDYQLRNWIITDKSNLWAWYFGPKTRAFTREDYISIREQREALVRQQEEIEKEIRQLRETINSRVDVLINSIWEPRLTHVWNNVRILQQTLKSMWYFNTSDTAYFWPITQKALISYQLDRWIISSENESWAWVFWPNTKEKMREELVFALEQRIFRERNLLAYIR